MGIQVRDAEEADAPALVWLIGQLADGLELTNPLTEEYARGCLAFPGSHVLLAETDDQAIGLLSYSVRPGLFHAGPSCTIDELIVEQAHRGRGVGSALLGEVLRRAAAQGCVEVSVTVMPDNQGAQRLYRSHGLVDEAVYLEAHLEGGAP